MAGVDSAFRSAWIGIPAPKLTHRETSWEWLSPHPRLSSSLFRGTRMLFVTTLWTFHKASLFAYMDDLEGSSRALSRVVWQEIL